MKTLNENQKCKLSLFKLLVKYYNLQEYRHTIEFDKGEMTYEELVNTVNELSPKIRKLAKEIEETIIN